MKPLQTRRLITIQRPGLWLLTLLLILGLILFSTYAAYEYGRSVAGFDSAESSTTVKSLQKEVEDLTEQLTESQRRTAMLERNSSIDGGASEQLKTSLSEVQAEAQELKKELAFYKSIVSPDETKRSLAIQSVQLKPDVLGGYRYKIMISQRGRNDRFARGSVDVTIDGQRQGQPATLKLSAVSADTKQRLKFGFKYFQNFEGSLKLPDDFRPASMRVKIRPSTSRIDQVNEQFAWADLTAGGT